MGFFQKTYKTTYKFTIINAQCSQYAQNSANSSTLHQNRTILVVVTVFLVLRVLAVRLPIWPKSSKFINITCNAFQINSNPWHVHNQNHGHSKKRYKTTYKLIILHQICEKNVHYMYMHHHFINFTRFGSFICFVRFFFGSQYIQFKQNLIHFIANHTTSLKINKFSWKISTLHKHYSSY